MTAIGNNDPDATVDVAKEEGTYVVASTKEVLLDDGNIPATIAHNAPQQNTKDDSIEQSLDVQTKKTLLGMGIAAVVMIIVVIILANVIGTQDSEDTEFHHTHFHAPSTDPTRSPDCPCKPTMWLGSYSGWRPDIVCGVGDTIYPNEYTSCPTQCEQYDDSNSLEMYYVQNASDSTLGTCYCNTNDDTENCFNAGAAYKVSMWKCRYMYNDGSCV
eukprot:153297_1